MDEDDTSNDSSVGQDNDSGKNNDFSSQYTNNMKNYGVDENCETTILIMTDNQQGSEHWKLLKFQKCKEHCMVKIFADMEHESTV